jgi:hypothetical protein
MFVDLLLIASSVGAALLLPSISRMISAAGTVFLGASVCVAFYLLALAQVFRPVSDAVAALSASPVLVALGTN